MATLTHDLLLGPDASSRIIARFGKGTGGWSHVAPVLSDGRYLDARSDVIGGVPAGVHIRDGAKERSIKRERWALEVTQPQYDAWEANLRARIGDAYGKRDILDFIEGRPGHVNGQWICSAHAIDALQHIHLVPYPLPWLAHELTPDDALLVFATIGFKKLYELKSQGGILVPA